jgi:hypothetical protein
MSSPTSGMWTCSHNVDGRDFCPDCYEPVKADEERLKSLAILHDALDLVVQLWPKPGYQTVTIETHQWIKLRRVLLEIPRLVAADE